MVEADLAFQGIDLRDLARPESGMTLRRLAVLIRGLPAEAGIWGAVRMAHERSLKPTPERIRERQEYYDKRAKEATDG